MGILLSAVALIAALAAARRSLADGVGVVLAVGYFYGILRANFPDGFSHFMFDAAVAGLYLGHFLRRPTPDVRARSRHAVFWLKALAVVPVVLFFVPLQNPLVQLVGLRAAIYFLPLLVIGARLEEADLAQLARWAAVLNVVAVLFGVAEIFFGVDRFYPLNPITELIFRSTDVGEERALRIPAIFTSAHAFGGTMLATLPLIVGRWSRTAHGALEREAMFTAAGASVLGIFMCGARTPVVLLLALGVAAVFSSGLTVRRKLALVSLTTAVVAVVLLTERFQRFATLQDVDYVQRRIEWSANRGLLDVALEYPMGAGLARAAGTSLPFFLADLALPQIGLENEYGRIVVEQGLVGLAMWAAFIAWTLSRGAPGHLARHPGLRLARTYVLVAWATALLGTGMLTAIPGTALLLLYMGMLGAVALPSARPAVMHPPAASSQGHRRPSEPQAAEGAGTRDAT